MNKKFLSAIVLIVTAATLLVGFAACETEVSTTVTYWVNGELYDLEMVTGTWMTSSRVFDPQVDGYRFDGWYTSETYASRFDFADYAANTNRSDISVYAKLTYIGNGSDGDNEGEQQPPEEAETRTVTFNVNGGDSEIASREYEVGSVMSLPTPARDGYRFVCWRDNRGNEYDNTSVMPDEDLRLTAVWEKVVSTFEDEYVTFKPATEGRKQDSDYYQGYEGVQEYLFVELTSDDLGGMNRVGRENNFDLTQNVEMEYSVKGDYTLSWYEGSWNNPNGAQMFTLNYGSNIQLLMVSEGAKPLKRYLVDIYVLHDYEVRLYTDIFADKPYDSVRVIENQRFDSATPTKQVADFECDGRVYYNAQAGEYVPYTYSDPVKGDIDLYQTYKPKTVSVVDEEGASVGTLGIKPYTQYSTSTIFTRQGQDFLGLKVMGDDDESDEDDWFFTDLNGTNAVNYLSAEENFDALNAVFAPKQYYQYLDEEDGTKLHVAETIPVAFYADETRREIVDVVYVPEGWAAAMPDSAPVSDGNEVFKGWQTYAYNDNPGVEEWRVDDFDFNEAITEPTAVFGEFQDLTVYGSASSVYAVKLDGTTTFETGSGTFRMYLPVEGSYILTVTGDLTFTLNKYLNVNAESYAVDGTRSVTIDYFREPGTTVTEPGGFVSFTVGTLYGSGFDVTLTGPNASVTEETADRQDVLLPYGKEGQLLRAAETEEGQYFKVWKDAGGNEVAGEDLTVTWSKSGDSVLTAEYYSPFEWSNDLRISIPRADYVADLGVIAADADGNALEVTATLLDASGEAVADDLAFAGEVVAVKLTALSDEGRTLEATIEGVKVYGMPTISYQREQWYYQEGEDVTTMFSAVDSFGQTLTVTVNVEEQTEDGVYVLVTATDDAGNTATWEGQLTVLSEPRSYLILTVDGVQVGHATVKSGEAYQLPALPGYDFRGWQLNGADVTDEKGNSLAPWDKASGVYTLTADADLITYMVTYDLDGGANAAGNPTSYTVLSLGGADGSVALADPSKVVVDYASNGDGSIEVTQNVYTFLGWYKDASFEQKVTSLTLDLGDVTLYAKWSEPVTQTETKQYVRVDENNEMDEQGEYILFGWYPQTIKADGVTVGGVADGDGYYLGSDGARYAKVVAAPYGRDYTFSDGSSVTDGATYYFKVEPIRWRILSEDGVSAFILADRIVANHYFHHTSSSTTIDGKTVYANNYKHSDIRAWLNDEFLNTAFGEIAQSLIETTEVDNSAYSTGYSSETGYGSNPYACENTFDKVFLLSYREVTDSAYGFASRSTNDAARIMKVSDYARSTGAYMYTYSNYFGCGNWWLRSPLYNDSRYARSVSSNGYIDNSGGGVYSDDNGVVPALNILL